MIAGLSRCIAARIAHGMAGFLILRICARLSRIVTHLPQAIARTALPTRQRPPRPYIPRPPKPPGHPADAWRLIRLPSREGWLHRLMPLAANQSAADLRQLLAEPDMAALAGNPRGHRLLRPLCRMLGVTDCLPSLTPPGAPAATPTPAALATRLPPPATEPASPYGMLTQAISYIWPPFQILPAT